MFPSNEIVLDLRLWPVGDHERQLLAGAADVLRLVLDRREGPTLRGEHLLDDRLDLARLRRVVERVELDLRLALLQLVLDVRRREVLRAAVVDDLDPLALGHPERDDLALRPVGDVDLQVLEEPGVPQALEVVAQPPLVVRVARLRLHVEQQRLALQELVPLDLDALDRGRLALALLRPRVRRRERQEQPRPEQRRPRPLHADSAPPRSPCVYHSWPSLTPTSIGVSARMRPRMKASDSASSTWRWIARRSGRAP